MELAQNPQYMNIVQFIISYIRENRKYIPPAEFIYDYPEQLDKNYTILLSTLDGPNYGLWLSELYKEAESMGLEVTNQLLIDALAQIRKEKDSIISYTRLFIDLLRWCDGWTNPSYDISDYDQAIANMHIGHAVGQIMRLSQSPPPTTPTDNNSKQNKIASRLTNGANAAAIGGFFLTAIFGLAALLPNQQITEQNELIAEQNRILTEQNELQKEENKILAGIWYEQQKDNDLTPTPTPECTPAPPEQLLST